MNLRLPLFPLVASIMLLGFAMSVLGDIKHDRIARAIKGRPLPLKL